MRKAAWRRILYGEVVLFRLAVFLIGLLIISQALLLQDGVRPYLSRVDRFEGTEILTQTPQYAAKPLQIHDSAEVGSIQSLRDGKSMVIRMIKPAAGSDIYATVNGKVIADFGKGAVTLTVYHGDYVEVDAREQAEKVQLVVSVPGGSLEEPVNGLVLEGGSTRIPVGKVKFKN